MSEHYSEKWHGFVAGFQGNANFCQFCGEPEKSYRHRPATQPTPSVATGSEQRAYCKCSEMFPDGVCWKHPWSGQVYGRRSRHGPVAVSAEQPGQGSAAPLTGKQVWQIYNQVTSEMWRETMKGEHMEVWDEIAKRLAAARAGAGETQPTRSTLDLAYELTMEQVRHDKTRQLADSYKENWDRAFAELEALRAAAPEPPAGLREALDKLAQDMYHEWWNGREKRYSNEVDYFIKQDYEHNSLCRRCRLQKILATLAPSQEKAAEPHVCPTGDHDDCTPMILRS